MNAEKQKLDLYRKKLALECYGDLFLYAKTLGYADITEASHGALCDELQAPTDRKLIVLPRGCFKSTLASVVYPMWRLYRNPNETIFLCSELYTNSKNLLREIRGNYESKKYLTYFKYEVGSPWGESEITIKSRNAVIKEASITAGGISTVKVGQHYSIIILDDLNSAENSSSVEKCQKIIDYVRYLLSILNPGGTLVIVGTRYHERDLAGWVLRDILERAELAEGKLE